MSNHGEAVGSQESHGNNGHKASPLPTPRGQDRTNILGVGISEINPQIALDKIREWVAADRREYVCVCTVHTIIECQKSDRLRRIVNASGMSTPDGMPLVWLARLGGKRHVTRVYGPDLMLAAIQQLPSHYGHFLYGGHAGVAERLAKSLKSRFAGVKVVGTYSPPMGSVEELATDQLAEVINSSRPAVVWVGISTPKQDMWMAQMRTRLNAPVLIGVGAAFDFHSGMVRQAPGWMQRSGLEWLFRLSQEPRRLWKRYLFYNTWFVFAVARQKLGLKRYELT